MNTTLTCLTAAMVFTLAGSQPKEPAPRAVAPGAYCRATGAPSDATVLFDGASLSGWTTTDGKPAEWKIDAAGAEGAMTIVPGSGSIISKHTFNDAQIHIEFCEPALGPDRTGQNRGNSGVYLQSRYEVQILDSFQSETYPDGQCGAVYGQRPPLVNACRKPGEWQTYDIVFHAAKFDSAGQKTANASVTVLHNGILIHDRAEITGTTGSSMSKEGPEPGPLYLQEHGHAVRFRNIWVRGL